MNKFLAGGLVLCLAWHAGHSSAQSYGGQPLDSLYDQGMREMAPNWRGLGKTHDAAIFIHNDVRKADKGRLSVWTHHELSATEYLEKEKAYLSTRDRMLIDCKASTLGTSNLAYYSQRFARGAVVGTTRIKGVEMTEVMPDSIEELLVKTVCAPAPRKAAAKPKAKAEKPDKATETVSRK
jgi:hypothetical protein